MKRSAKKSVRKTGAKATGKKSPKTPLDASQALRELFVNELKDIYWAEKKLTTAIPKMIKKAEAPELKEALTAHLAETETQVERLEQVFASLDEKAVAKKCEAMDGLVKEAEEIMKDNEEGAVRDAGIILAGQKVEHYEIATYGTMIAFARLLELDEAEKLLKETLDEEKGADEKLSVIAASSINIEAAEEPAE